MREVTEEEDAGECGDAESDGGNQLGYEGLPEFALREEIEDALIKCQLRQGMVIGMVSLTLMG